LLDLEQSQAALVELVGVDWLIGSPNDLDIGAGASLSDPEVAELPEHPFGVRPPVGDVARSLSPSGDYGPKSLRLAAHGNE
jgi:hypothetical protein